MRISDWSSDVCSSDLLPPRVPRRHYDGPGWTDYGGVAGLQGLLVTASPWRDWTVRAGLFRSLIDRKSTRLNSSPLMRISYAVFCLKKKKKKKTQHSTSH